MSGRLDLPDPIRDEDIDPAADFAALELAVADGNPGALMVLRNLKDGLPLDEYKRAVRWLMETDAVGERCWLRRTNIFMRAGGEGWPA